MRNYTPGQRGFIRELENERAVYNRNRIITSFKTVSPLQAPIYRSNVLTDLFGNPNKSFYKEVPVTFYREDIY